MDVGGTTMSNRDLVLFENNFQLETPRDDRYASNDHTAIDGSTGYEEDSNGSIVNSSVPFFQTPKLMSYKELGDGKLETSGVLDIYGQAVTRSGVDSPDTSEKLTFLGYDSHLCDSSQANFLTKATNNDGDQNLIRQYARELGLPAGSVVLTLRKPTSVALATFDDGTIEKAPVKDELTSNMDWDEGDSRGYVNSCQLLKHGTYGTVQQLPKYMQKDPMSSLNFDIFTSSPSLRSPSLNSSTVSPCSSCLSVCSPNDLRSVNDNNAFEGNVMASSNDGTYLYDKSCDQPTTKKSPVCLSTGGGGGGVLFFNKSDETNSGGQVSAIPHSLPMQSSSPLKQPAATARCSSNKSLTGLVCGTKKEYFWRYNLQAKGPKTTKSYVVGNNNPYVIRPFIDPVCQIKSLQRGCSTSSISSSQGKLRKGDGNDITPNPMKLLELGRSIRELTRKSQSLNSEEKQLLKREKNRLASRSCRLKKKAQHEANKIKLDGLAREHRVLLTLLEKIKSGIIQYVSAGDRQSSYSLTDLYDQIVAQYYDDKIKVAGDTDGYVSRLLESHSMLRNKQS